MTRALYSFAQLWTLYLCSSDWTHNTQKNLAIYDAAYNIYHNHHIYSHHDWQRYMQRIRWFGQSILLHYKIIIGLPKKETYIFVIDVFVDYFSLYHQLIIRFLSARIYNTYTRLIRFMLTHYLIQFCHHHIVSLYRMYTYTDVISWERKSLKLRHIGRNVSKDFIRSPIPFDGIQCFVFVKVECTIEDRITTSYYCFRDMNTKVL